MKQLLHVTVEITRSKTTRYLSARVVQQEAGEKLVRGENLLFDRRIRRIETAKREALAQLLLKVEQVTFDVQASPDLETPYNPITRKSFADALS